MSTGTRSKCVIRRTFVSVLTCWKLTMFFSLRDWPCGHIGKELRGDQELRRKSTVNTIRPNIWKWKTEGNVADRSDFRSLALSVRMTGSALLSCDADLYHVPIAMGCSDMKFPSRSYPSVEEYCSAYQESITQAWKSPDPAAIARGMALLSRCLKSDGIIYACGNGGSAAIANHMSCDFKKASKRTRALHLGLSACRPDLSSSPLLPMIFPMTKSSLIS